ncbi:unnamed product [Ostreococcus tauri]|uniref:Unnamed product n=2 Tax=Ostreococcus tauri TaxID=70448 RepID=A0A090MEF2_OSTTA|nr:unnamed product [Ostreococcus tauri]CEG01332.1 unnamed product [Ostreococcus tauri]|eukprot:XP_003080600.2 unnamed product [Ostreococcus tauri]
MVWNGISRAARAWMERRGMTERDVDGVVRVVHPGPLTPWPPRYDDVRDADVREGDAVAAESLRRWATRTGRVEGAERGEGAAA